MRAEPDPGKEGNERHVLAGAAEGVERLAEDLVAYLGPTHHGALAATGLAAVVDRGKLSSRRLNTKALCRPSPLRVLFQLRFMPCEVDDLGHASSTPCCRSRATAGRCRINGLCQLLVR
jgi:hypothetical protein